jgi:O-methyltransferase
MTPDRPKTDRINALKADAPVTAARRSQPPRPMAENDLQKLVEDATHEVLANGKSVRVLGLSETTSRFLHAMADAGLLSYMTGIHSPNPEVGDVWGIPVGNMSQLTNLSESDIVVVAADSKKESLLRVALPFVEKSANPTPKVIVAGYGHYKFADPAFHELQLDLLVESLANGHPNNLIHIFQCLQNAHKLGLQGSVTEFGMYQGGTTMFISRAIEKIGASWPVFGFDNFAGFPPKKSMLDMYDDPGCAFASFEDVSAYLSRRPNLTIVPGDICETAEATLSGKPLVFSFVDTDNYTASLAGARVAMANTVLGGAVIFDHVAGTNRFRYTLGEFMAARDSGIWDSPDWFHLHDTGVFLKQR